MENKNPSSQLGLGSVSLVAEAVLVFAEDAAAAAQLLPDLRHLLPKGGVLPFQIGGPYGYLVLLEAARIPGTLRRLVVFMPPGPVLLILRAEREREREML